MLRRTKRYKDDEFLERFHKGNPQYRYLIHVGFVPDDTTIEKVFRQRRHHGYTRFTEQRFGDLVSQSVSLQDEKIFQKKYKQRFNNPVKITPKEEAVKKNKFGQKVGYQKKSKLNVCFVLYVSLAVCFV